MSVGVISATLPVWVPIAVVGGAAELGYDGYKLFKLKQKITELLNTLHRGISENDRKILLLENKNPVQAALRANPPLSARSRCQWQGLLANGLVLQHGYGLFASSRLEHPQRQEKVGDLIVLAVEVGEWNA
jgi:hypothetical protein